LENRLFLRDDSRHFYLSLAGGQHKRTEDLLFGKDIGIRD